MTKDEWMGKIEQDCRTLGTYDDCFVPTMEKLAQILETMDETMRTYTEGGYEPVVLHEIRNGNKNLTKNPLIVLYDDLSKTALLYWRELGLTPAGLKKIKEKQFKGTADPAPVSLVNLLDKARTTA